MSIVAAALSTEIDDIIDSEGAKGGSHTKWKDLSESTLSNRRGQGAGMLQVSGLLASIQTRVTQQTARAASPAPYAGFHITGTVSHVARDFMDVDDARLLEEIGRDVLMEWQRRF